MKRSSTDSDSFPLFFGFLFICEQRLHARLGDTVFFPVFSLNGGDVPKTFIRVSYLFFVSTLFFQVLASCPAIYHEHV